MAFGDLRAKVLTSTALVSGLIERSPLTHVDKIKRPLEIVSSAVRAADGRFNYHINDSDTGTLLWRYDQAGQPLFGWRAPNGFPDHKDDWQSASPRVMTWRLMN